jgi:protein SCO1
MLAGMASRASSPPGASASPRLRWVLWVVVAALVGSGVGIGAAVTRRSSHPMRPTPILSGPAATWAAGARPAPQFSLVDQNGKGVSLGAYRGRPVLVTFMDPLCTTFCPIESKVVDRALGALPASARPVVVAVSVNPPNDQPAKLKAATARFGWRPQWRWAVGPQASLGEVWKRYEIAVLPTKGDVTHTEALYLVDSKGDERALFLWPFRAADLTPRLRELVSRSS